MNPRKAWNSIRLQLLTLGLAPVVIGSVLLIVMALHFDMMRERHALEQESLMLSRSIALAIESHVLVADMDSMYKIMTELSHRSDFAYIEVRDEFEDRLVYSSGNTSLIGSISSSPIRNHFVDGDLCSMYHGRVMVAMRWHPYGESSGGQRSTMILASLFVFTFTLLFAVRLYQGIIRPIGVSMRMIQSLRSGEDLPDVVQSGTKELRALQGAIIELHKVRKEVHDLQIEKGVSERTRQTRMMFLATVSHELRTPINALVHITRSLMRDPSTKRLSLSSRMDLRDITSSAKWMGDLVENVLDFASIDSGIIQIKPVEFDLIDTLESVITQHAHRARDRGIVLTLQCTLDLPNPVYADRRRIWQVMNNLLSNAIKATPPMGYIRVMAHLSDMDMDADPGITMIRFSVDDTGQGVPVEDRVRIFLPFETTSSGLVDPGGVGVGLATVHAIVRGLHGRIHVFDSQIGPTGSRFVVDLPVVAQDDNQEHEEYDEQNGSTFLIDAVTPIFEPGIRWMLLGMGMNPHDPSDPSLATLGILEVGAREPMSSVMQRWKSLRHQCVRVLWTHPVDQHEMDNEWLRILGVKNQVFMPVLKKNIQTAIRGYESEDDDLGRTAISESGHRGVVLAVDDQPTNLRVLSVILEPAGYRVLHALDGTQALKWLDRETIDAAIVDLRLANGERGDQLAATIMAKAPHAKVAILTADMTEETRDKLQQACLNVIYKPVDEADLIGLLRGGGEHDGPPAVHCFADKIKSMQDQFLSVDVPEHLDQLITALPNQALSILHTIKGSAAMIGLDDLTEKTRAMEISLHTSEDTQEIDRYIAWVYDYAQHLQRRCKT